MILSSLSPVSSLTLLIEIVDHSLSVNLPPRPQLLLPRYSVQLQHQHQLHSSVDKGAVQLVILELQLPHLLQEVSSEAEAEEVYSEERVLLDKLRTNLHSHSELVNRRQLLRCLEEEGILLDNNLQLEVVEGCLDRLVIQREVDCLDNLSNRLKQEGDCLVQQIIRTLPSFCLIYWEDAS